MRDLIIRNSKHKNKVLYLGVTILFLFMFFKLEPLTNTQLEKVYYITQILGIAFVGIGAFLGFRQYILTSKNELAKFEKEQIQKAIDLAQYYKDNILPNMIIINQVYNKSGMIDILKKVKIKDMKDFDKHELHENFSQEDLDKFKDIMMSDEFCEVVAKVGVTHGIDVLEPSIKMDGDGNIITDDKGKPKFDLKVNKVKVHKLFVDEILVETLNSLEYFSMHFTYNTADESVVYQSLHKTYLDVVQLLYYDIAINNKTGESKYFTNVKELFNIWQEKSDSIKQKEVAVSREIVPPVKKAKAY